jgi:ribosomal protein S18 acetylase RimI-like enzyme
MEISQASEVTPELVAAFARLLPQLAPHARPLDAVDLREIVAQNQLLVARDDGKIVGTLTLVLYRIPSGRCARIESVVVDGAARGAGVGAALCTEAIARARAAGADAVDLTSVPARAAANRLYLRLGFVKRETNVYRYPLRRA